MFCPYNFQDYNKNSQFINKDKNITLKYINKAIYSFKQIKWNVQFIKRIMLKDNYIGIKY